MYLKNYSLTKNMTLPLPNYATNFIKKPYENADINIPNKLQCIDAGPLITQIIFL